MQNLNGYIVERLQTSDVARALLQDDNAAWSFDGAKALAEYMEQLAEDMNEPIELDIIAWRCDFHEANAVDIANDYNINIEGLDHDDDAGEIQSRVAEYLTDHGALVAELGGGRFVYQISAL